MKIVIVCTFGFQELNGGTLRLYYLSRLLLEKNHFIDFVVPSREDAEGIHERFQDQYSDYYRVKYSRFLFNGNISSKTRYLIYFLMKYTFAPIMHDLEADLIYCHNLPSGEVVSNCPVPGIKILDLFDIWSSYTKIYKNPLVRNLLYRYLKWREGSVFNKIDHLILCTAETRAEVLNGFKVAKEQITLVHDGVDIDLFQPGSPSRELRESLDLTPSDFVVTFHGGMKKHDGLHLLVDAVSILKDRAQIKALMIGAGNECNMLKDLAVKQGVKDLFRFVGKVEHEKVRDYLLISNIGVITRLTWQGDIAASMMECMACGLPLVSANLDGIEKYFTDGEDIVLFKCGDSTALSRQIFRLYSDSNLYDKIQGNARKSIARFDRRQSAEKIINLFHQLLDKSPK